MKSIIRVICLIIGAAGGFVSGQWKGQAETLRVYASPRHPASIRSTPRRCRMTGFTGAGRRWR
jgi:hypothetical protein